MKDTQVFFNPFRLISPKLDAEASRLAEIYESPPGEVTCLEEGLLIMISKLMQMSDLIYKNLLICDVAKAERCKALGQEVHDEEKGLTGDLVCSPLTTGEVLKTLVLFPGRVERIGDLMESILNVASIKARDGIPFSDRAQTELEKLFGLSSRILSDFRDAVMTNNPVILENVIAACKELAQLTLDFALAHEERLIDGLCTPKASSLYLDILDSERGIARHIREMSEALQRVTETHGTAQSA